MAGYTYDPDRTFTYTGDTAQPFPGYVQVFPSEEEELSTPLIGRPGRSGYYIGSVTTYDENGDQEPPLPVPPPGGNWTEDTEGP